MAIELPASPKVYTTKYQNWRGVDFTNDASNVWYRRSPNGLNMLPNLDGQPFKRNGWKIEQSEADFIEVAQNAGLVGVTEIEQYKVDYFELGGTEYLWFYTSVGCFVYDGETLFFVDKSYKIANHLPYVYSNGVTYKEGDFCRYRVGDFKYFVCTVPITTSEAWNSDHWQEVDPEDCYKQFPPIDDDTGTLASIDYGKSFFFEGGGTAGYYLFANGKMYMFGDSGDESLGLNGMVLIEINPYIPTVLTMCDKYGAGELYEDVNMLNEWRAIEYTCDEGGQDYVIPDGFLSDGNNATGIHGVYTRSAKGDWARTYDWSVLASGSSIHIGSVPSIVIDGGTNLRVIYKSANASVTEKADVTTANQTMTVTKTTVTTTLQHATTTQVIIDGKTVPRKEWRDGSVISKSVSYSCTEPSFYLTSPKSPLGTYAVCDLRRSGYWDTDVPYIKRTFSSYGHKVTLSAYSKKTLYDAYPNATITTKSSTTYKDQTWETRKKVVTKKESKTFTLRMRYTQYVLSGATAQSANRNAFNAASKSLTFGNGIINQQFITASTEKNYNTRVWYSAATDPTYFPDLNYIEVGATDKAIVGLTKVGNYLGIVKQGGGTDTSIYLAYPTSFENTATYAVKQSINGFGALSNGAFNILNDEPLYLSSAGIMGIEPAEDDSWESQNRSYYINKKLLEETGLETAFSFVHDGMYWLCVNDHCYVLDGNQKISWENTKTNLQYECYYLDNIPARCFARKDNILWFVDGGGNLCRFKEDKDEARFADEYLLRDESETTEDNGVLYSVVDPTDMVLNTADIMERHIFLSDNAEWNDALRDALYGGVTLDVKDYIEDAIAVADVAFSVTVDGTLYEADIEFTPDGDNIIIDAGQEFFDDIPDVEEEAEYGITFYYYSAHESKIDDTVYAVNEDKYYTVIDITEDEATLSNGVPIHAVWGTIADDDGAANYYKKLQKKGSLVAVMPLSDSGVEVTLIPDEKEPIFVGKTETGSPILPFNYYLRKKVKNYKRLQIICENNSYNNGFGVDEIIKTYTMGNYAKR